MARIIELDTPDNGVRKTLTRSFQSAHVSFLMGSGASQPAIPTAGRIEQEIADLFEAGREEEARMSMYGFLSSIQEPMNKLIEEQDDDLNDQALGNYQRYLGIVETILSERRTDILPKQATIFTTTTAYILLAIQFEERDLVREHGDAYEEYRRSVPMLVPFVGKR